MKERRTCILTRMTFLIKGFHWIFLPMSFYMIEKEKKIYVMQHISNLQYGHNFLVSYLHTNFVSRIPEFFLSGFRVIIWGFFWCYISFEAFNIFTFVIQEFNKMHHPLLSHVYVEIKLASVFGHLSGILDFILQSLAY